MLGLLHLKAEGFSAGGLIEKNISGCILFFRLWIFRTFYRDERRLFQCDARDGVLSCSGGSSVS